MAHFYINNENNTVEVLAVISKNVKKFFIRARMNESLCGAINRIDKWEEVTLDDRSLFRGSVKFTPFEETAKRSKQEHLLKECRLVVTKEKRNDGQINLFTGEAYNYSAILTNDFELADDEVVFFYNQRGASEKEFDILKNDFAWDKMPFSKIEHNTVLLILTAICRNLYNYIIRKSSKRFKFLSPKFRIKKFIFRFICIPAKWVVNGGQKKLRVYGELAFKT